MKYNDEQAKRRKLFNEVQEAKGAMFMPLNISLNHGSKSYSLLFTYSW